MPRMTVPGLAALVALAALLVPACNKARVDGGELPRTLDLADFRQAHDALPETTPDIPGPPDLPTETLDLHETWTFDPASYDPVHGWILLDADPAAVTETIETAAAYGVNHIQLSHGLIMNVEDVLGGDAEAQTRVETLNMAIDLAHQNGMKAYVWAHELSGIGFEVCFAPDDPVWEQRADAYRQALALLPDLDGIILMFGSAPSPPWFAICACDWCLDNYDDLPLFIPPNDERIRIITEHLGQVIVNEQGRELFVRTFVHEPAEIPWHNDGLAAVDGVAFTGMHKGPVQDWQPYNPHHPSIGNVGPHPSVMELDLAGEYYGISVLPWCAPGYYWYRLDHLWRNRGIGVVARVQRGASAALGTPNEVNLLAVRRLVEDHDASLGAIWDEFLSATYGLQSGTPEHDALEQVLRDTFPIRRKSHYALGIWALEKSSDFPDGLALDELNDRGKMPKWNPLWQETWDALDVPDRTTVLWLWQEGSEAVDLAAESLDRFTDVAPALDADAAQDLSRRLTHQWLAARAWRAMDLFIWSHRAKPSPPERIFDEREAWMAWARQELEAVKAEM